MAADEVDDLRGNGNGSRNTVVLDRNEATSTLSGKLKGNLVSLQDAVSVSSVIVGFQVVDGNHGTSGFNGRQGLVVVLLVGQADEDRLVADELSHDLGLTGNGGTDLISAHGEQIPRGFSAQTDQVTSTGNALNDLLDVGISQVLGGQVEGGLGVLAVKDVQELSGIIGRAVIEGESNNTTTLTGVTDGSVSKGEESSKNESNVDDHDRLCVCVVCCQRAAGQRRNLYPLLGYF